MAKASNRRLYFAASVASLTGGLFGYSVGFIGGVLVLPSFLSQFALDQLPKSELASALSAIVTLWLVGTLVGVPLASPICARYGRKRCMSLSAIVYVIGAVLQVSSSGNVTLFDLGRFINGIAVGAGTLVSPMYISEVSPASERGMLMSGYQTAIQLCALIGFWGAFVCHAIFPDSSALQWQLPVAAQLIPGGLLVLGTFFIPETPRYLAIKKRYQDAETSLAWLRSMDRSDSELLRELRDIQDGVEAIETMKRRRTQSFFQQATKKSLFQRLHVGIGLMIAQNMVGLNALNYYCPVIFMSAGFTSVSSSLFLTGIFGLTKVIAAIVFMFFFVRVKGNLFWLKLGTTVCGVSMFVLAYYVKVLPKPDGHDTGQGNVTVGGVVSVLMVYIFAFAFGNSLGPISWNVCSEIFPLHINTECCTISTWVQWLFQGVIAGITPHLLSSVGWGTYIVYGGFCFLSLFWVMAFVPETRGVPVGKAMDELFARDEEDDESALLDEEGGETEEVAERTALIRREHRRSSVGTYM